MLYSELRIPAKFGPSRARVRGPCEKWQRAGRVKKRPLRATELVVLCVCNSTVQIGIWINHRSFFFRH